MDSEDSKKEEESSLPNFWVPIASLFAFAFSTIINLLLVQMLDKSNTVNTSLNNGGIFARIAYIAVLCIPGAISMSAVMQSRSNGKLSFNKFLVVWLFTNCLIVGLFFTAAFAFGWVKLQVKTLM